MARAPIRLALCLAAVAVACLALPAFAAGNQLAALSGGTMTITGDQDGKPDDRVTVNYDQTLDQYLIGFDIDDPIPEGCTRDPAAPKRQIYCPRSLITSFVIDAGDGAGNKVIVDFGSLAPPLPSVVASFGTGNDAFEGGDEVDQVDMGPGNDQVESGGGNDQVNTRAGSDKVYAGEGNDRANTGSGSDQTHMGDGNDFADMGSGSDKAMGDAGNDKLKGGSGSDKIFGGSGADALFGGPAPDTLLAGPGNDSCNGGPSGNREVSC